MGRVIDLTGKIFGRWKVIERSYSKNNKIYWLCECSCDKHTIRSVNGSSLKRGLSISCGCLKNEITSARFKKHGMTGTRIYNIWKGMRKRCYNPNSNNYHNYGGRGITICNEWSDFRNFYDWAIENGYQDDLTIERKNNNGNYEPSNCKWATMKEQANNSRNNHEITIHNESKLLHEWSEEIGITSANVLMRISKGLSDDEILKGKNIIKYEKSMKINIKDKEYTIKEIAEITGLPTDTIWHRIRYGWTGEKLLLPNQLNHINKTKEKVNT